VDRTREVVHSTEIDNEFYGNAEWWNPSAPLRALHDMNPFRLAYFEGVIRQWGGMEEASVWKSSKSVDSKSDSSVVRNGKNQNSKKKEVEKKKKKGKKGAVQVEEADTRVEQVAGVDIPKRLRIADIGSGGGIFTEALFRSPSQLQTQGFRPLEGINGNLNLEIERNEIEISMHLMYFTV
jgi:2-polyprenyl-3-methyl-5-hydroxy-6-metoxy-1,4-benzoquinol methylase